MLATTGLPETFPSSGFCLTCWHWGEASPEDQPAKGSLEGLHRARPQSHPHGWLRTEERLSPLGAASLPAHPGTPPPSLLGHRQVTAVQETSDTRRTQGQGACGSVSPGHGFPCHLPAPFSLRDDGIESWASEQCSVYLPSSQDFLKEAIEIPPGIAQLLSAVCDTDGKASYNPPLTPPTPAESQVAARKGCSQDSGGDSRLWEPREGGRLSAHSLQGGCS